MDIYTYLEKDHRKVSDLMKQLVNASKDAEREDIFEEIRNELLLHAETEEQTFYQALKEGDEELQDKESHAEEEHDEIRRLLNACDDEECGTDLWLINFGQLKYAVEHHVEEEEEQIFPKARKTIPQSKAKALAEEMESLKQDAKRHAA